MSDQDIIEYARESDLRNDPLVQDLLAEVERLRSTLDRLDYPYALLAFMRAWEAADEAGQVGQRVKAGIGAAREAASREATLTPPPDAIRHHTAHVAMTRGVFL